MVGSKLCVFVYMFLMQICIYVGCIFSVVHLICDKSGFFRVRILDALNLL